MHIERISAEATWPVRHAVLWPNKPIEAIRLEKDDEGIHYGLYVDSCLIAVISVFIKGDEAQFRKFATKQEFQGQGYGSKLFEHMLHELKEKKIRRIWCNARLDANDFYKRYGFKKASGKIFNKGPIGYTIMERY